MAIVIFIDGGLVSDVVCGDGSRQRAIIVDSDTEGGDPDRIVTDHEGNEAYIQSPEPTRNSAIVRYYLDLLEM